MSKSSIRDTFFEECEDLLEALTEGLTGLETAPDDDETVNAVFRAVHSIKGGAGAFGLDDLVSFAHSFETVMDRVRARDLMIDADLNRVFHRAGDKLADLVEAARVESDFDAAARDAVLKELAPYLGDAHDAVEEDVDFGFATTPMGFEAEPMGMDLPGLDQPEPAGNSRFQILFVPSAELYRHGHEPLLVLDHLAELGQIDTTLDLGAVPDFSELDRSSMYPGWTIRLETDRDRAAVEEVFEFVEGLCRIEIAEGDEIPDPDPVPVPVPEDDKAASPEPAAAAPAATLPQTQKAEGEPGREPYKGPKPTLRVDLDRVDRLINAVGELIINQAMINQCIEELDLPPTSQILNEIEDYKLLARDIQEGVMAIRAQPVKPLFQRMARIVREASEATGKQVQLSTLGENTEVDKTVIERLADPLTHMIRNAVDHGLETPQVRTAAGKGASGTIRLSAAHRSGNVILEITDDGAGINRQAVQRKAIEKGLIAPDAEPSEGEIDNLLFAPGFSTATEISNLSGRGVGMDVVKNAVQKLGGRITVTSTEGEGSTFAIILPLTLAVMDGFVVSVADQTMVVPITSIMETVSASEKDIHIMGHHERLLLLRGRYIPIVDVAQSLQLTGPPPTDTPIYLIVQNEGMGLSALEIGEIHDQRQIVVKSLDFQQGSIPGISAATILGDGKIALILDTEEIATRNAPISQDVMSMLQFTEFENV